MESFPAISADLPSPRHPCCSPVLLSALTVLQTVASSSSGGNWKLGSQRPDDEAGRQAYRLAVPQGWSVANCLRDRVSYLLPYFWPPPPPTTPTPPPPTPSRGAVFGYKNAVGLPSSAQIGKITSLTGGKVTTADLCPLEQSKDTSAVWSDNFTDGQETAAVQPSAGYHLKYQREWKNDI